jgi:type I restriction enzyme S subunit
MGELPVGWEKVELEQFAFVNMGQSPKGEFVNQNSDGIPFYQGKAEFGKSYPTPRKNCIKPTKIAVKNDILLSIRAPVGPTNLCPEESCIGRGLAAIRSYEKQSQTYLLYYFNNIEPWLSQQGTGSTFRAISGSFLKKVEVRVAPLNEQIRIANKLDSLLAKVEAAQTRLDKIPTLLKRFRQAVLAAATSGELTKEWRGNIAAHSNWKSLSLIDVVETKPRNGKSPKGVNYETKIKNLTLSAVTPGYFVEGKFKFIDLEVPMDSHLWVKNGDILIQRANTIEYVGISALYQGVDNKYVYPDLIMKCRANEKILPHFLHYSLLAGNTRKYFRENATGTAGNMPKINQKIVCLTPVMVPPIEEQKQIVKQVESLFALADKVDKQYQQARQRTDKLTQSLLAKAFKGELVPQDPNDEPAEKLLVRIQAERGKQKPVKKVRKNRLKKEA